MVAFKNEKMDYHISFTKTPHQIKEVIDKSPYPLINNKTLAKI